MTNKKGDHLHALVIVVSTLSLIISFIFFVRSTANANPAFNSGKELRASECDTSGSPVVNVTEKIVQTVDSGQGGNYWALDNVNRKIQVWQNSDTEYCALIQNEGTFDSQKDQKSPGNTGLLTGDEDGNFRGGYRAKITGVMLKKPNWQTKGNVGTHNYNCTISGNCPGYINWTDQYFGPGYKFNYEWWGWTYRYKNNTWVNASDGNSGDVL